MLDSLFISVLNMSMVAGYAIAFVLITRLLLKKAPKIFSYALWAVVLFRLLCPFAFESAMSVLPKSTAPIPQNIVYSTEPQINTGLDIVDNVVNPILPVPNNIGESMNPIQFWIFIGSSVWIIGIVALSIYSIVAFIKLKRNLIGATPFRDNIYLVDHISSPFVIGLLKPQIYLPSSLSDREQAFIIAHEMHHIKRFDHVTRILGFIAASIHWFNPLVWIAFILSEKDMEMSCDESVMKQMDKDIRAEYSQSLLRFATVKKMIYATPLAFGEGDTKGRVKNVMKYKKPMMLVVIIAMIAVACMAVALISNPNNHGINSNLDSLEANSTSVKKLWENRTEYVGNNSAVGNIISELTFPGNVVYDNFELKTDLEPYGITAHFNATEKAFVEIDENETALNIDFGEFETNAKIIFSLIGNVKEITFEINKGNGARQTTHYQRKNYDDVFGKTKTFEGFKSVLTDLLETSDNNILSDFEAIKIGTKREKIHEQFGNPDDMLFGMFGDVYLVDDKQVSIYYDGEKEKGNLVTEVKINGIERRLTFDEAVSLALTSDTSFMQAECEAEGHIILGYDDSDDNSTKIYALTMSGHYGFENDNFVKVSGTGVVPLVVTLDSMNNVDAEHPLDGSYYQSSIQTMFPQEYHERIFNSFDSEYDNLKQQEQRYAKDYLEKIGREAKIGDTSDFEYSSLTDMGVLVAVSNGLEVFYKSHNDYPDFIGTREQLEDGIRMEYEMSYHKNLNEIRFTKYFYDTKEVVELFQINAKTGDIVTLSNGTKRRSR